MTSIRIKENDLIKGQRPYRPAAMGKEVIQLAYCGICEQSFWWPLRPSMAMVTSKRPQWLWKSNLTSDLIKATLITLASMCILSLIAIMVASEAIVAFI